MKDRNVVVSLELFNVCILLHISLNPPCAVYSFWLVASRTVVWETEGHVLTLCIIDTDISATINTEPAPYKIYNFQINVWKGNW